MSYEALKSAVCISCTKQNFFFLRAFIFKVHASLITCCSCIVRCGMLLIFERHYQFVLHFLFLFCSCHQSSFYGDMWFSSSHGKNRVLVFSVVHAAKGHDFMLTFMWAWCEMILKLFLLSVWLLHLALLFKQVVWMLQVKSVSLGFVVLFCFCVCVL